MVSNLVDNFMGDTQLAKDIIKYGCHSTHLVDRIVKATHLTYALLIKAKCTHGSSRRGAARACGGNGYSATIFVLRMRLQR